jgi:3-oxoacyl-[acyl-carrier-protein] synthase-1
VSDLTTRSGVELDVKASAVVRAGHAGGAFALEAACTLLSDGAEAVLLGGVDSYVHPDVLAWLDEECRLHALGAEDGFVPGEAAAFCLLRGPQRSEIRVTDVHTAMDDCVARDEPDVSGPMSTLLQKLSTRHGLATWILSDDNGEDHRRRWWRLESARGTVGIDTPHTRLPRGLGDVGAATGVVAAAVATKLWQLGAAPDPACVIALHSEAAERGVIRLEHAGAKAEVA